MVSAIVAAVAALTGVFLGARLTQQREANNWSRDQRLKAYTELATVVEESDNAFTLLAAAFRGWDYEWEQIEKNRPKVLKLIADWDAVGEEKIGKAVTAAELVASQQLWPRVMVTRFTSHRQQVLLMKFSHLRRIDPAEWKTVEGQTHKALLELRAAFRAAFRADIQRTLSSGEWAPSLVLRKMRYWATSTPRRWWRTALSSGG